VGVGMGVHPFGDPTIRDEFSVEAIAMDPREFHLYTAEWRPEHVAFFVDHRLVKTVQQSPGYPMQPMLGIYEFPDDGRATQPARRIPSSSSSTTSAATGPPRRNRPRAGSRLLTGGLGAHYRPTTPEAARVIDRTMSTWSQLSLGRSSRPRTAGKRCGSSGAVSRSPTPERPARTSST
jgi:hypothetical protein